MELQAQDALTIGEGLVRAIGGAGQAGGSVGDFEPIAVPVQDRRIAQGRQGAAAAFGGQRQWREADFLVPHRVDMGAQYPSNELGAKADAQ
ncbi:hypothetical protein D3C78_1439570 [compost metagenome]